MFKNISGKRQGIFDKFGNITILENKEVVSEVVFPNLVNMSTIFAKLDCLSTRKKDRILFKRNFALGDIIMTLPIANYYKDKNSCDINVLVSSKYSIEGCNYIQNHPRLNCEDYDTIVNLNGVVEIDHYDSNYFEINRVDIYKEALGIKEDIGNNWRLDFPKKEIQIELVEKEVIGIQNSGSKGFKSIDLTLLIQNLKKNKIKYFIIDKEKMSLLSLLNLMEKLKGIIVFDSAPLWLSHVTNTPAFVITGVTSGKKITSRHPNVKTTFFDTKIDGNCPLISGCGESASWCNGDFSCMKQLNHTRLKEEFLKWYNYLEEN